MLLEIIDAFQERHAALWERGVIKLLDPNPSFAYESSINDRGQIVGYYGGRGFVWEKGILTGLGALPGSQGSLLKGDFKISINNKGQVAGTFRTVAGELHAFLWQKGVMTDLGTLGGTALFIPEIEFVTYGPFGSSAVAINDKGQVIGFSLTPAGEHHAFLWQKGVMTDLGILGGPFSNHPKIDPIAINNKGQVIGYSTEDHGIGQRRAFLWQKGVMTELKPLPGASSAYIGAINNKGQIVGASGFPDINLNPDFNGDLPDFRATLWNSKCEKNEGKREREERH